MSAFNAISFNINNADQQLRSFKLWLSSVSFVGETAIVGEIKSRPQMACLLGATLGLQAPDLIKFELALKGMFKTDLVLGNNSTRTFGLVEFEDACCNSIFKKGTKQYRYWAPRIEHGFSQIIDWAWVRSDHPNDTVLINGFGGQISTSSYLVICGRDASLNDDTERKRFAHRRSSMKVEGHPALIMTYDEMVNSMDDNLTVLKSYSSFGESSG
jgi:Domain of unknown function (DUF4263)